MAKSEAEPVESPLQEETGDEAVSPGDVGESVRKVDGRGLVTGRAKYTDDIPTADALEVRILRSPHAHAEIASLDTDEAAAIEGVHAVLTHESVPDIPFTRTGFPNPEPAPYDEYVINDKVRFVGDPVAAVAAESADIAEAAIDAIDVEYDVLDHVLDPEAAMAADAPRLHSRDDYENAQDGADLQRNVVCDVDHEEGDVERGFEEADVVVEDEYETQIVQHAPMEMNTSIAWIDDRDRLVLRTSTQIPHLCRDSLARAFDMDRTSVRVVKPRVGGGFGVKQDTVPSQFIAAALALETGERVRLENTREEDLHVAQTRHAQSIRVKTGATEDGDLTAMHVDITSNTGAYGCHAFSVMSNAGHEPMTIYSIDNRLFTGRAVYTNVTPAGAFRGYGAVQGAFALESHMDVTAREIGMDPIAFRRRNHIEVGEEGFEPSYSESEGALKTAAVSECLDEVSQSLDWEAGPPEPEDDRVRRGQGIALTMHKSGVASSEYSGAHVTLEDDGTCTLKVGVGDVGQGAETTMAQIAAGVLGIPTHDIHVKADDTDATPWDNGAYGSSTTYVSGNATQKAARELASKIRDIATRWLSGDPENFELRDGSVVAPDGDEITIETLADHAFKGIDGPKRRPVGEDHHFTPISPKPFAAQGAAVEVDTDTGEFEVTSLVSAADCGFAINPENARGQVIGGAIMGLGQALSEDVSFDEAGTPEITGFRDYDVPRSTDVPAHVECVLVEPYEPTGPFGAKSVGEVTNMGPPPAVANAIEDAVGVRIRDLPITAEKIERALDGR